MSRFRKIALLVCAIIVLYGCARNIEEKSIIVASKSLPEQYVLSEMLAMLIEDNTDLKVIRKFDFEDETIKMHEMLLNKEIDVYAEYTGSAWVVLLGNKHISNEDELFSNVKNKCEKEFGVTWFERYGFDNSYALAIKKETSEKYKIKTNLELIEKADKLVFGAEHNFLVKEEGLKGLKDTYKIKFKEEKELKRLEKYDSLENGEVDVISVNYTDGQLHEYELVILEDDINYFPIHEAATIVREETLKKYPELVTALKKLEFQISEEEMIGLNYLIQTKSMDYKVVARDFLESKNLLMNKDDE